MKVSAQYAEEHFADIVHTAMRGEDVEIDTPEQPSLRLTLVQSSTTVPAGLKVRPLGRLKGLVELPTDEEWAAMDREIEDLMVDGPLISSGEV
jgi:antitoxin (DNA-binding transcriptional repressor) of toxin-antitoxin stability system